MAVRGSSIYPWRGQLFCNNSTGKGNIAWRA
jgi:hypothetical protein